MNYTEKHNLPGMLVLIDFEKAFNTISWTFINYFIKLLNFLDLENHLSIG